MSKPEEENMPNSNCIERDSATYSNIDLTILEKEQQCTQREKWLIKCTKINDDA
jgi:hypothetical protein